MRLYGISGLGADKRVFKYLKLNCDFVPIDWIEPLVKESIEEYAKRLSQLINKDETFGILGVSFGGLVAIEMSKILNPAMTILISSAETKHDLRWFYRMIGKTGIIKFFPKNIFDPPRRIAYILFGTTKKDLLNNILNDTDLKFAKWAVNALVRWKNEKKLKNVIRINGTKDKLIPPPSYGNIHLIEKGEHFMIVDKAEEISEIINRELICYLCGNQSDQCLEI